MNDLKKEMTALKLPVAPDREQSCEKFITNIITQNNQIFNHKGYENKGFFTGFESLDFPSELKKRGRFCCWSFETDNGRQTKIPYQPETGQRAKSNDQSTFSSFPVALQALEKGQYAGIGIGIFNDICAIDIDHCVSDDGVLSDEAWDIINTMKSYTEFSPSGQGIHILFLAQNFQYDKEQFYVMNSKLGLEIYVAGATKKYVTITGNVFGSYGLRDCTEELNIVLKKYMQRPLLKNYAVNGENAVNGKNAVIEDSAPQIRRLIQDITSSRDIRLRKLWNGQWEEYYGSHSEADFGLCLKLAPIAGYNPALVDTLFRQSGLMRDKWDRSLGASTYGATTINNALKRSNQGIPPITPFTANTAFTPMLELGSHGSDLPLFPVDALPDIIGKYVRAVSNHTQTAGDMAGSIALGVLAACVQGRYRIEGSPGYFEPLSLYMVVVAQPGDRKSGVMNHMTSCLYDYEASYNDSHAKELHTNMSMRKTLNKRIEILEERLASNDTTELKQQLEEAIEQLEDLPEIKPLRLLADDCSSESLTNMLSENGGRMAVISAEGGIFDIMAGRYSQKANIDVWLKGHCGDTIMVDRLGRSSEMIRHPHLTAVLAIQPSVLEEIMANKKMNGRGLIARFLFSSPPSQIGHREYAGAAIPDDVFQNYNALIHRILDTTLHREEETLKLSSEATEVITDYFQQHEKYLAGEGQAISEWASKYIGAVLRIAGLLHVGDENESKLVSAETLNRAIQIGKYFLSHSEYAYALMGNDETLKKAKFVLEKIKNKNITEIKKWELLKECRSKLFLKAEDMQPALQLLEECGYIIIQAPEERTGAGRKSDVRILVNPLLYNPV